MDLAKLKVVELRAHLAARGLDQKGVKAVLVSRLQAALEQENQQNIDGANNFSSTSGLFIYMTLLFCYCIDKIFNRQMND